MGQMQMYVNYYDRIIKTAEENQTISIYHASRKIKQAEIHLAGKAKKRSFPKNIKMRCRVIQI